MDLNPIEQALVKLKALLRMAAERLDRVAEAGHLVGGQLSITSMSPGRSFYPKKPSSVSRRHGSKSEARSPP